MFPNWFMTPLQMCTIAPPFSAQNTTRVTSINCCWKHGWGGKGLTARLSASLFPAGPSFVVCLSLAARQILTGVREALPAWRPLPDSDIQLKQVRCGCEMLYYMSTLANRQHTLCCLFLVCSLIFDLSRGL